MRNEVVVSLGQNSKSFTCSQGCHFPRKREQNYEEFLQSETKGITLYLWRYSILTIETIVLNS